MAETIVSGSDKLGVFGHGFTYSGHPIAAAAALANLKVIEDEKLVAQAGARGEVMHKHLRAAFSDHPAVGDVRGFGLIGAVEFVAELGVFEILADVGEALFQLL